MDTYNLQFLIERDTRTFYVTVPRTEKVGQLTQLIFQANQTRGFAGLHVYDLTLLKVDIDLQPFRGRISEIQSNNHQNDVLEVSAEVISDIWSEQPPEIHVHIIVKLPAREEVLETLSHSFVNTHRIHVRNAQIAPSPSSVAGDVLAYIKEQAGRPIYNGRPDDRRGPPVVIYNDTLAKLKHCLNDLSRLPEPPSNYVGVSAKLFRAAIAIYGSERERGEAMYCYFTQLFGVQLDQHVQVLEENFRRKPAEGDVLVQETIQDKTYGEKKAVVTYMELKNELGIHGDGSLQAALSLRKHISQKAVNTMRYGTYLAALASSCIIISIAGPYIQIYGAVFVEVFTVQKFTDPIYLGGDPYAEKQINYVAKVLYAVVDAVRALRTYYRYLRLGDRFEDSMPSPVFLPNSPLVGSLNFKGQFNPEGRRADDYHQTSFVAEYNNQPVLVKFCERYSGDAHRLVADAGFAPTLHFCSLITGDTFMVIMDLVDSRDAFHEFLHLALPLTVVNDVKLALEALHAAGLVHGDVRRPNIMVFKSQEKDAEVWRGRLIDFDWAGPVGKAKYPAMLNDSGQISWANGVAPAIEIKKEHDIAMLERLSSGANE